MRILSKTYPLARIRLGFFAQSSVPSVPNRFSTLHSIAPASAAAVWPDVNGLNGRYVIQQHLLGRPPLRFPFRGPKQDPVSAAKSGPQFWLQIWNLCLSPDLEPVSGLKSGPHFWIPMWTSFLRPNLDAISAPKSVTHF